MHAYYTGAWGPDLQPLSPGKRYRLSGVKKGDSAAKFSQDDNVYVRGPLAEHYDRFLRCSWEPLLPKRIWTLQRMKVEKSYFAKPIPSGVEIPDRIGSVQVLSFDFDDVSSLSVLETSESGVTRKLSWRPQPEPIRIAGNNQPHRVVNLHIFADPAHSFSGRMAGMNYEHPMTAFSELMRLTQVPELRLRLRDGDRPVMAPDASVPDGLPKSELMSLAQSGLLNGKGMAAAAVAGAGSWLSMSGRTEQSSKTEDRGNGSRRAFLGRLGACALGGAALSQVALGIKPPYSCTNCIVDPSAPPPPPPPPRPPKS